MPNLEAPPRSSPQASAPPPPRTLSTLADNGSRIWLNPRVSSGRYLTARRAVAYVLIAVYAALPFLSSDGKPLFLLDLGARRFTIFGFTFLPTDTLLLSLFMVGLFVAIFLLTAVLGRVWCGWACPQTVYMEFVFRPIERLLQGAPGRPKRGWLQTSGAGAVIKIPIFFLICGHLANTFLAYFVGAETVYHWTLESPLQHPGGFMLVVFVTALMMFDFAFFREQTCLVACPYGRFQSVMLDRQSLVVTYDRARGEPRGRRTGRPANPLASPPSAGDLALPVLAAQQPSSMGDCVDCRMCVTTCPTGIDIRDGLQMECINCAQCIDACDAVMAKLKRPLGLVRYGSQAGMAGERRAIIRPRTVIYPAILGAVVTLWVAIFAGRDAADVTLLRARGAPFAQLEDGLIGNSVRIMLVNRSNAPAAYTLAVVSPQGAVIRPEESPVTLGPGQSRSVNAWIAAPRSLFRGGRLDVSVLVEQPGMLHKIVPFVLAGPGDPDSPAASEPASGDHP